jgi:hypothetical protein
MAEQSSVSQLVELLGGHAKPIIRPQRLAPATIYDIDYRMAVVALTIQKHGTKTDDGELRIDAARLKLFQFIAQRPNMLPAMRDWAKSKHVSGLLRDSSQRLRRGYLGDSTHDQVVEYMVACKILRIEGRNFISDKSSQYIAAIVSVSESENMFATERSALQELAGFRVTNAMLEGQ